MKYYNRHLVKSLLSFFLLYAFLGHAFISQAQTVSSSIYGSVYYRSSGCTLFCPRGPGAPNVPATTTISGRVTTVRTNANGDYSFGVVPPGDYTVRFTLPDGSPFSTSGTVRSGCTGTNCNNLIINIVLPAPATPPPPTPTPVPPTPTPTPEPVYTISGVLYSDSNNNGRQDAGEPNYQGRPSISASRGTITTDTNGGYTISNLAAGVVTVSLTNLPDGYNLTYPLNGPPPSFQVTVGPGCNTNGALGASCQ